MSARKKLSSHVEVALIVQYLNNTASKLERRARLGRIPKDDTVRGVQLIQAQTIRNVVESITKGAHKS